MIMPTFFGNGKGLRFSFKRVLNPPFLKRDLSFSAVPVSFGKGALRFLFGFFKSPFAKGGFCSLYSATKAGVLYYKDKVVPQTEDLVPSAYIHPFLLGFAEVKNRGLLPCYGEYLKKQELLCEWPPLPGLLLVIEISKYICLVKSPPAPL